LVEKEVWEEQVTLPAQFFLFLFIFPTLPALCLRSLFFFFRFLLFSLRLRSFCLLFAALGT
jgi:hypothetical protein